MIRSHYSVEIRAVPDFESGGYWAYVARLPGVLGEGDTASEAVTDCTRALESAISVYRKDGKPIPWVDPEQPKDGEHSRKVIVDS